MRIGRWNLDHLFDRVYYRRIWPKFHKKYIRTSRHQEENDIFQIYVTNQCNLECFSCSTMCDKPIGSNVFRDKSTVIKSLELDKFLSRIDGWRPNTWIRLSGGEPTLPSTTLITKLCNIVKNHDRKVDILTNGFKMMEIDPFLFDFIVLDYHGINKREIDECVEYFDKIGFDDYRILPQILHRDLDIQRAGNISLGLKCGEWMNSISLWRGIIYPCCVMANLEGFDDNPNIGVSLRKAGYSIENEKLIETLEDWRETMPAEVIKTCSLSCWRGSEKTKWRKTH